MSRQDVKYGTKIQKVYFFIYDLTNKWKLVEAEKEREDKKK